MPPSLPCEWDNDFWADERSFPLDAADVESPLKPEELQVLRAQYEKEGEYVGLQTKFNYAWVRLPRSACCIFTCGKAASATTKLMVL